MHSDNVSTTASQSRDRKSTKPIMEKRRRARINASLAELKSLLLEVIKREGARHSKMEKADILEMTVKHLKEMQRQSNAAPSERDPTIVNKHRLGFSECTQEVSRFLSNLDGCDVDLRTRLLDHLANVVCGTEPEKSSSPPIVTPLPVTTTPSPEQLPAPKVFQSTCSAGQEEHQLPQQQQHATSFITDLNNNISTISATPQVQPTKVVSGLQVIPTKLQSGEIAFVLPGNVLGNSQVSNYIIPVYASPNTSPVKPAVAMTTGTTTPGSFMTIVPSSDVFQTCAITPGSIGIISQPLPSPSSSSSPCSTSDVSISPLVRHGDVTETRHLHRDVRDSIDTHQIRNLRQIHEPTDTEVWRPW